MSFLQNTAIIIGFILFFLNDVKAEVTLVAAMDCNGQIHLGSPQLGWTLDYSNLVMTQLRDEKEKKKRARCVCPDSPESAIENRFGVLPLVKYMLTGEEPESDECLDEEFKTSSIFKKVKSTVQYRIKVNGDTCTDPETRCDFTTTIEGVEYFVSINRCPARDSYSFSIHCVDCDTTPCTEDSDCRSGNGKCLSLDDEKAVDDYLTYLGEFIKESEGDHEAPLTLKNQWRKASDEIGIRTHLYDNVEEGKKCGSFDKALLKVVQEFYGKDVKKICVAPPLAFTRGNATRTAVPRPMPDCYAVNPSSVISKIELKAEPWNGILPNQESARFNLATGKYGSVPSLKEKDGALFSALTCDGEFLTRGFGFRLNGFNRALNALRKAYKEEWDCRKPSDQEVDDETFELLMEVWSPLFWLSYGPGVNFPKAFAYASDIKSFRQQLTPYSAVLRAVMVPLSKRTFNYQRYKDTGKVAQTLQIPGLKADVWMERCQQYPHGLPSMAIRASGELFELSPQRCNSNDDCKGTNRLCLTEEEREQHMKALIPQEQVSGNVAPPAQRQDIATNQMWGIAAAIGCLSESALTKIRQCSLESLGFSETKCYFIPNQQALLTGVYSGLQDNTESNPTDDYIQ